MHFTVFAPVLCQMGASCLGSYAPVLKQDLDWCLVGTQKPAPCASREANLGFIFVLWTSMRQSTPHLWLWSSALPLLSGLSLIFLRTLCLSVPSRDSLFQLLLMDHPKAELSCARAGNLEGVTHSTVGNALLTLRVWQVCSLRGASLTVFMFQAPFLCLCYSSGLKG